MPGVPPWPAQNTGPRPIVVRDLAGGRLAGLPLWEVGHRSAPLPEAQATDRLVSMKEASVVFCPRNDMHEPLGNPIGNLEDSSPMDGRILWEDARVTRRPCSLPSAPFDAAELRVKRVLGCCENGRGYSSAVLLPTLAYYPCRIRNDRKAILRGSSR